MNIHHLELFYYVARHGGISEAVRNMPYGLQQPAMSAQVIQLEEFLGLPLFQRRPFALTPAGEELYAFIQPFFENLNATADRFEKEDLDWHRRLRDAFLEIGKANAERCVIIDADRSEDALEDEIWRAVSGRFPELQGSPVS